jgi:hypothetical protein
VYSGAGVLFVVLLALPVPPTAEVASGVLVVFGVLLPPTQAVSSISVAPAIARDEIRRVFFIKTFGRKLIVVLFISAFYRKVIF